MGRPKKQSNLLEFAPEYLQDAQGNQHRVADLIGRVTNYRSIDLRAKSAPKPRRGPKLKFTPEELEWIYTSPRAEVAKRYPDKTISQINGIKSYAWTKFAQKKP